MDSRLTITEGAISTLQGDVSGLQTDVANNTVAITALDGRVTTNESAIASLQTDVASNTSAITALDGRVTTNESAISTLQSDVTALDGRVTTNESGIVANTAAIAALDGDNGVERVGNIFQVKLADSSLIADTAGLRVNPASATDPSVVTETFVASEAISAGDPVAYDPALAGRVNRADAAAAAATSRKRPIGIAKAAATAGGNVEVLMFGRSSDSELSGQGISPAPGTKLWLKVGGGVAVAPPTASGESRVLMGYADSTTNALVRIQEFGLVAM